VIFAFNTTPNQIEPDYTKVDLTKSKSDINSTKKFMSKSSDKLWWDQFFEDLEDENSLEVEDKCHGSCKSYLNSLLCLGHQFHEVN
jgi:hypothetical protein